MRFRHFKRVARLVSDCARRSHPPTHWHAETCQWVGEGLPVRHTSLQGSGRGCPLLRASNEHSFTVRVLRARRAPGHSLLSFSGRALREHRRLTGYPFFSYAGRGARTSNDRRQDPHHNQRGQAPFAKLKEPVPIIEKYYIFPLKSWFRCERNRLSPSALTPTNKPTHSRSFLFLHSHGGLCRLRT